MNKSNLGLWTFEFEFNSDDDLEIISFIFNSFCEKQKGKNKKYGYLKKTNTKALFFLTNTGNIDVESLIKLGQDLLPFIVVPANPAP